MVSCVSVETYWKLHHLVKWLDIIPPTCRLFFKRGESPSGSRVFASRLLLLQGVHSKAASALTGHCTWMHSPAATTLHSPWSWSDVLRPNSSPEPPIWTWRWEQEIKARSSSYRHIIQNREVQPWSCGFSCELLSGRSFFLWGPNDSYCAAFPLTRLA